MKKLAKAKIVITKTIRNEIALRTGVELKRIRE